MSLKPVPFNLHDHPVIIHEKVDPISDDCYLLSCNACGYPIFSSSSYICSNSGCNFLLHQRCFNLPEKLEHQFKHKDQSTTLVVKQTQSDCGVCIHCKRAPQNFIYQCHEDNSLFLHFSCAFPLEVRVIHQSHEHELTPICKEALFSCDACGDRHKGLSYFCHKCGFWLHRDCASRPTIIRFKEHESGNHTLSLSYTSFRKEDFSVPNCEICKHTINEGLGYYFCSRCRYYAHLKCATKDKELYRLASRHDIETDPNIAHLPMKDEHTNIMSYILKWHDINLEDQERNDNPRMFEHIHNHPLTCHYDLKDMHRDGGAGDDEGQSLTCDLCIEFISPPYYSCFECSNFFLHYCCAHLPESITHVRHPRHFFILTKPQAASGIIPHYFCNGCKRHCSGFSYKCETCREYSLDIMCALLPNSTTHEAHERGHVLFMELYQYADKNCCNGTRIPKYAWTYRCRNCSDNYCLHVACSLLPTTIQHKYDQHNLKLMTSSKGKYDPDQHFCEICEESIHGVKHSNSDLWYYHCNLCDTSFHIGCIPSVSPRLAKIKFGGTINVSCHKCPLISIRMLTWHSYPCSICGIMLDGLKDNIAFKCPKKCGYIVHYKCARENSTDKFLSYSPYVYEDVENSS